MKTRRLVLTALCIAMGIALPMALHGIPNAGMILLPMHIPVLLCGLACGWPYGLVCGILTPLISSAVTGMPPAPVLPGMVCELAAYGLAAGLLYQWLRGMKEIARIGLSLVGAMLAGRVVMGAVQSLIFQAGAYSLQAWIAAAFVTAFPGIVIQLVLLPLVVLGLKRAKLL